jgi:hypothetical protein
MNQIVFIILGLSLLVFILSRVKNKLFSEKESLIWIIAGLIVLVFSIFPSLLDILAHFLGVVYQPTALFLMTFFAIVLILLRKEQQLTQMNEKIKELAQQIAILEEEIRRKKQI